MVAETCREDALSYIQAHRHERAVALPLVLYEIYQGEVFKSGPTDFDAIDTALEWLVVLDETPDLARAAAELQDELASAGTPLTARDAYIAGTANALDERLVVSDSDFDVPALSDLVEVDFL